MSEVIIDVRERDEFDAEHVEHAINVPLSMFNSMAPGVLNHLRDRQIVFMCRGGARAAQALAQAQGLGFNDTHQYSVYPGGILQWIKEGRPVHKAGKAPLPLIRQVQLIVGSLVTVFGALGVALHPIFAVGAVLMGLGLVMTGATGNCVLAAVLAKAPWNKANPGLRRELCQATTGSLNCK